MSRRYRAQHEYNIIIGEIEYMCRVTSGHCKYWSSNQIADKISCIFDWNPVYLDLWYDSDVTESSIVTITDQLRNLERLDYIHLISATKTEQGNLLVESLQHLKIQKLLLQMNLEISALVTVANQFQHLTQIQFIQTKVTILDADTVLALTDMVSRNGPLEDLYLEKYHFSAGNFETFSQSFLTNTKLRRFGLMEAGLASKIHGDALRMIVGCPIVELNLNNNELENVDFMSDNETIIKLDISQNKITNQGLACLTRLLSKNVTLRQIIAYYQLGPDNKKGYTIDLFNILKTNTTLKEFTYNLLMGGPTDEELLPNLLDLITTNNTLKSFAYDSIVIGDQTTYDIFLKALACNSSLTAFCGWTSKQFTIDERLENKNYEYMDHDLMDEVIERNIYNRKMRKVSLFELLVGIL